MGDTQASDLAELRAQVAALQAQMATLLAERGPERAAPRAADDAPAVAAALDDAPTRRRRSSRRTLLTRLGASAAGAAGLALAADAARPTPARAAPWAGSNLVISPNTRYGLYAEPDGIVNPG